VAGSVLILAEVFIIVCFAVCCVEAALFLSDKTVDCFLKIAGIEK